MLARRVLPFVGLLLRPSRQNRTLHLPELIAQVLPRGRALAQLGELDAAVTAALAARVGHESVWVDVESAEPGALQRWHREVIAAGLLPQLRILTGSHLPLGVENVRHAVVVGQVAEGTVFRRSLGSLQPRAEDRRITVLERQL